MPQGDASLNDLQRRPWIDFYLKFNEVSVFCDALRSLNFHRLDFNDFNAAATIIRVHRARKLNESSDSRLNLGDAAVSEFPWQIKRALLYTVTWVKPDD